MAAHTNERGQPGTALTGVIALLALVLTSACSLPPHEGIGAEDPDGGPPPAAPDGEGSARWRWLNPTPQGNRIRGIGGSADDNVWLVGDVSTVVHWDGEDWFNVPGPRGFDLYAVGAVARDDVWLAGDTGVPFTTGWGQPDRWGSAGEGGIFHFDGESFERDLQIGSRWAHSLFAAAPDAVFALLERGDVARYDGEGWLVADSPTGGVLRDVWGASSSDAWAVGDGGTIAHYDGNRWLRLEAGVGDPVDDDHEPANPAYNYYGIWGSSASDIWAAFATAITDDYETTRRTIGFSHWDGGSWKVKQLFHDQQSRWVLDSDDPRRFGHSIWGAGGGRIVAFHRGALHDTGWFYDGETWAPEPAIGWFDNAAVTAWSAGSSSTLLAAGEVGAIVRFHPDEAVDELRWEGVFPVFSGWLESLAVAGPNDAWAVTRDGSNWDRLIRWTTAGWKFVSVPTTDSDSPGLERVPAKGVVVTDVVARSTDDVWVSGYHYVRYGGISEYRSDLVHWNGRSWQALEGPGGGGRIDARRIDFVWPSPDGRLWVATYDGLIHRWTGTHWAVVPTDRPVHRVSGISGSSATDVWVNAQAGEQTIFHFDGISLRAVFSAPDSGGYAWRKGGLLSAPSPNNVWAATYPTGPYNALWGLYHFNGERWSTHNDVSVTQVWAAPSGGAYYLSAHNGKQALKFSTGKSGDEPVIVDESSGYLASMAGTHDVLWATGKGGATVKLELAEP